MGSPSHFLTHQLSFLKSLRQWILEPVCISKLIDKICKQYIAILSFLMLPLSVFEFLYLKRKSLRHVVHFELFLENGHRFGLFRHCF